MAVKKATAATKRAASAKRAAPTKAAVAKAVAKSVTKTVTKAGPAKSSAKAVVKSAPKANVPRATAARGAMKALAKTAMRALGKTDAKAPAKATTKAPAKTVARAPTKTATKTATRQAAVKTSPAKVPPTTKIPRTKAATNGVKVTAGPAQAARPSASASAAPRSQRLLVRENEKPWTAKELRGVRSQIEGDITRLQYEISVAETDLAGLMRDAGDGAGDDQADAGTATFEREQEISLANNARELFEQSRRALARLVDGSYGVCESCGNPIGKNRLLAFPRATLCMTCKSKQERR